MSREHCVQAGRARQLLSSLEEVNMSCQRFKTLVLVQQISHGLRRFSFWPDEVGTTRVDQTSCGADSCFALPPPTWKRLWAYINVSTHLHQCLRSQNAAQGGLCGQGINDSLYRVVMRLSVGNETFANSSIWGPFSGIQRKDLLCCLLKRMKTENWKQRTIIQDFLPCSGSNSDAKFAQPMASCRCPRVYIAMIHTLTISNLG